MCCFKLLNFGIIYYEAINKQSTIPSIVYDTDEKAKMVLSYKEYYTTIMLRWCDIVILKYYFKS